MNTAEKRRFVVELIQRVQEDVLLRISEMPDDWDGHELRRYIADQFEGAAMTLGRDKSYGKRFRAYKNEKLVRNL